MLRVWLPLTKDLRNQGLDDVTVTNNGATFNSAGKLGGCYYFNGSGYLKETSFDWTNFNTSEFSLCCWYKEPSPVASGNSQMVCIGTSSGWNNIRIGLLRRTSNGYPMFSVSDGTNNVNYSFTADSFTLDTWNHIVCTYNNGTMKMYLNGILHKMYTTTITPLLNSSQHLGVGAASNGSEPLVGYLNDVRIYDHCLSPMEVKELSKGLILHYPLNKEGWGQENLFIDSTYEQADSSIANSSTDWSKYFRRYNGSAGIHSFSDYTDTITLSTTGNLGVTFQRKATDINLDSTSYYTISCEAKSTQTARPLCIGLSYYNNSNSWVWRGGSNPTYFKEVNKWQKFTLTFKPDADTQYIDYCFTVTGVASGTDTFSIRHCKMEKGSIATPWCPNSSDNLADEIGLNGTTEYDCSGFGNNGTRTGTFSWTSDTPKYAVSQIFNGTDNAIQTPNLLSMITDKNYTIAVWIYKTVIGSKNYQTIYGGPSGFELEARNGTTTEAKFVGWNWGKPAAAYEFNEWNHCVFVHSDDDCKVYLNGEYVATGTAKASNPSGNYFVGAWNTATQQNFEGLMSDFCIYATALSADDVKSLYQNSAYIDSSGNVYGTIHES